MDTKKALMGWALAMLLVGWGITSGTLAAERSESEAASEAPVIRPGSLGAPVRATDVYHVLCGPNTHHLHADVGDSDLDNMRLGVCVHDTGGNPAQCTVAPDGAISQDVQVNGGVGAYYVTIFKSQTGTGMSEDYDTEITCHNSSHGDTTTTVVLVQNQ